MNLINDYVHIINTKSVEFSNDKLEKCINETVADLVLSTIMEYYKSQWPVDKTKIPNLDELRYFWSHRNDIT